MKNNKIIVSLSCVMFITIISSCNTARDVSTSNSDSTNDSQIESSYISASSIIDSATCEHSYRLTDNRYATFEEDGFNLYTCSKCGYSYRETFNKKEHSYATYLSSDRYGHYYRCTDQGYDDIKKDYEPHDFETTIYEPTELMEGFSRHTCKICNYSYDDNRTDKLPPSISYYDYTHSLTDNAEPNHMYIHYYYPSFRGREENYADYDIWLWRTTYNQTGVKFDWVKKNGKIHIDAYGGPYIDVYLYGKYDGGYSNGVYGGTEVDFSYAGNFGFIVVKTSSRSSNNWIKLTSSDVLISVWVYEYTFPGPDKTGSCYHVFVSPYNNDKLPYSDSYYPQGEYK